LTIFSLSFSDDGLFLEEGDGPVARANWFALSPVIGDFGDPGDRTTWNFLYGFRVPSFTICGIDVASALKLNPPLNADVGNGLLVLLLFSPPMVTFEKELFNTACAENGPPSAKLVSGIFAASLLTLGKACILLLLLLLFCILLPLLLLLPLLALILLLLLLPYDFGFVVLPLKPPPPELPPL